MALAYQKEVGSGVRIALWKIEESSAELLMQLQLNDSERAYLQRIDKGKRTSHWLGTRVLLRKMLHTDGYIDCPSDENGKPYLTNFPQKISLTHSFDYAGVMLSDHGDVGIDLELVSDKIERIASRFLKPAELNYIQGPHRIRQLYACWCAKEAVYKLQGKKGVSFRDNILIGPFVYQPKGGMLQAQLNGPYKSARYEVYYEEFGNYMLGYTSEQPPLL
ncbi:Phosphopantetheinyl transferase [bacterium A37T11]|nr:Phosphopantetheinyl transferase [bacterium A37T11]